MLAAVWRGVSPWASSLINSVSFNSATIFENFGLSSLTVNFGLDLCSHWIARCKAVSPFPDDFATGENPLASIHSKALHFPRAAAQWMRGNRLSNTASGTSSSFPHPPLVYLSTHSLRLSRFDNEPSISVQFTIATNNSWCSGHSLFFSQNGVHLRSTGSWFILVKSWYAVAMEAITQWRSLLFSAE